MQLADLVRDYGRTLVESLVGCCFLAATWAAQRTKRWLFEHLEREKQLMHERETQRANETLRILSEASVNAAPPTLGSLLEDEKRDLSLESSGESFVPPTPMSKRSRSDGTQTRLRRLDWSDDDLPATKPETPSTIPPPSDPPHR